jgi:hypothetical protein
LEDKITGFVSKDRGRSVIISVLIVVFRVLIRVGFSTEFSSIVLFDFEDFLREDDDEFLF